VPSAVFFQVKAGLGVDERILEVRLCRHGVNLEYIFNRKELLLL
jgi:hypothetical protein